MNLFVLDLDPVKAAGMACDRHVVKMTIETAQILCSAFPAGKTPYKPTHTRHPCSVWARTSQANYTWAVEHGLALAQEYTRRYGKVHATEHVLRTMAALTSQVPFLAPHRGLTPFALAMPEDLRGADPVAAYQRYYLRDKAAIATWTEPASPPVWWTVPMVFHAPKNPKTRGRWKLA